MTASGVPFILDALQADIARATAEGFAVEVGGKESRVWLTVYERADPPEECTQGEEGAPQSFGY